MSAIISACGGYRFELRREVFEYGLTFAYFGVNPSTADANVDDATVRKWTGFTVRNGGSRFLVGNVFPFRATNVSELARVTNHRLDENAMHLSMIVAQADVLVPCWGDRSKLPKTLWPYLDGTLKFLLQAGKPLYCFGLTKGGDPKHPLMLPYSTRLEAIPCTGAA